MATSATAPQEGIATGCRAISVGFRKTDSGEKSAARVYQQTRHWGPAMVPGADEKTYEEIPEWRRQSFRLAVRPKNQDRLNRRLFSGNEPESGGLQSGLSWWCGASNRWPRRIGKQIPVATASSTAQPRRKIAVPSASQCLHKCAYCQKQYLR